MNSPCGPCPTPSEIGSWQVDPTSTKGMALGLAVGLVLMVGENVATGVAARACGVAGAQDAATNRISAAPAHLIPVERAPPESVTKGPVQEVNGFGQRSR